MEDLSLYSQNTKYRVCGTGWVQVERTHCAALAHEWNGVITWNGVNQKELQRVERTGLHGTAWSALSGTDWHRWNGVNPAELHTNI